MRRLRSILVFFSLTALVFGVETGKEFELDVRELSIDGKKILYAPLRGVKVFSVCVGFKNAGRKLSPKGKEALALLLAQALGEATVSKSRELILAYKREHNLAINVVCDNDDFIVSGTAPSRCLPQLFRLMEEIVFKAAFPEKDLRRIKSELKAEMAQATQTPWGRLGELAKKALLAGHPYGYLVPELVKSLDSIAASDLKNFVTANLTLKNVHVAVCGEVDEAKLIAELKTLFAELPKNFTPKDIPTVKVTGPYVRLNESFDVPQTAIRIVHEGIDYDHPDFFALQIAGLCLGNSTTGVLWKKIREERGLAYGLTAKFDIADEFDDFAIATATNAAKVDEAIALIRSCLAETLEKGFTPENFELVKSNFLGDYKRSFVSTKNIASRLLGYSLNGFGKDRHKRVIEGVGGLTLNDVNAAFKKFFKPKKTRVFTVGR